MPLFARRTALAGGTPAPRKTIFEHSVNTLASVGLTLALVWMLLGAGNGFVIEWNGLLPNIKVAAKEEALGPVIDTALRDNLDETRAILRARDFHRPDAMPPEALPAMLDAALERHAVVTRAILRDSGFLRVSDPALLTRLAELAPDDPVSVSLRQLLFDMRGPFAHPSTLDGARSRFIAEVLERRPKNDSLVTEIWSDFIGRSLSFLYPPLKADLVPADIPGWTRAHDNGPRVRNAAACRGSDLERKFVQVWHSAPGGGLQDQYTVYVGTTLGIGECRDEALTLVDFANGAAPRLGLPQEHFASLEAGAGGGQPLRFDAVIFPAGLAPFDLIEERQPEEGRDGRAGANGG